MYDITIWGYHIQEGEPTHMTDVPAWVLENELKWRSMRTKAAEEREKRIMMKNLINIIGWRIEWVIIIIIIYR